MNYREIELKKEYLWRDADKCRVLYMNKNEQEIVVEILEGEHKEEWFVSDATDITPLTPKLPETGLVVGDGGDAYIMRTGRSSGYGFRYVGIDNDWVYEISDDWSFESDPDEWDRTATKADEKRWKELLEREAVRLGFVEGVRFKGVKGADKNSPIQIGLRYNMVFVNKGIYCGNSWIMIDGKWAEIIEDEKVKEDIVVKLKQHTGQEYIMINGVNYYPEKPKDLHEIARSVEGEELDKLIDILHEKKVTSKFDSEGFKIVKK